MRILVTINCLGVDASAAGGIALARMMVETGHYVTIQAAPDGPVTRTAAAQGLECTGLNLQKSAFVTGLLPFRKLIRSFAPDVIVTTRADGQTASATVAGDVPMVRIRCDIRKPRSGRFWKRVDRRTNLVVFPSPFMIARGYTGEREGPVAVIPHPVDTDLYTSREEREVFEPLLVSIGRLSPMKGHRTLIRALELLPENVKAVVAGSPSQQSADELESFARSLGVEKRITFAGKVEDVRDLISRGTIGVVTSLGSEVVSRAGMEMMSTGLPLLAAATNGLLDLVEDGRTGLFHSPGNYRQLASQAAFLLRNPSMALRMGRSARKICIDRLSYPVTAEIWNLTLKALIEGNKIPSRRYHH
ncbi:MAG: glycosyltransferase family 4 protein [Candidatus Aegiribacteria sp.]|nr:glycosyltransferase family 4 protein [Candidatus Aegiribacteria sp.]